MPFAPQPELSRRPGPIRRELIRDSVLPNLLYALAAILIGRAIVTQNHADPTLKLYSQGLSAMPFRARYLMTPILRWADTSPLMLRAAHAFRESSLGPQDLLVQFVDALAVLALGPIVVRLRNAFSPARIFPWLSPLVVLWVIACTYVIRYESRLFLPYDLLSVALFSLGLIACVEFRTLLFLLVVIVGTYNRETTIFLIPIWLTCNYQRSRPKLLTTTVLALIAFTLIKLQLREWTGHASSGIFLTFRVSARLLLHPHHWPQLASVGGYLVLPLWFARRLIHDPLLKRVWLGFIPFFCTSLLVGWWNETRIFGEFTCLIAVTAAIVFEQYLRQNNFQPPSSILPTETAPAN